ncbi:HAD family hydrolase [Pelovirga terrestris]|uniref:phosphoglycolate phosphatase n=1 Tax=Pelovirga terrestris TaxID=2771352 RepID=A0A8J6QNM0_9BACT|nr:HAD family hydrolase [Pelovirga terrestris]MBD1400987.1 HAD family hydrolase [Pelovirga terrestris]
MKEIEAIIYDCDGVLFESHAANLAYYNQIFSAFGYPPITVDQQEKAYLCHTASSPVVLAGLMRATDVPAALSFAAEIDYREFIPLMKPMPHLHQVLEVVANHYPLAIATNRGGSVMPILEHFGLDQFFSAVVTSRDVKKPKPAPDMLLLAARQLGYQPFTCLFIGDSELDQAAAAAGSFHFAGYGERFVREKSVAKVLSHHLDLLQHLNLSDSINQ